MKMFGGIVAVLLMFGFVGMVAAEGLQDLVGASASETATSTPPLKERVQAFREDLKEKRDNAFSAVKDAKEKLKDRGKELRENLKDSQKKLQERQKEIQAEAKERRKDSKQEIRDALENAREKVKNLEGRLKELRVKASLSAEEKAEFKSKVLDRLQALFDQHIKAALRLEAEGVNGTLVAQFVAFAELQKTRFVNATNNTVRKELVVEFNQKWRAFKQAAQEDLKKVRLREVIAKSAEALVKLDATISRLKTAGFNVTALEEASVKVKIRLDLAANASTFEESMANLRAANRGLIYLKQAIRLTIRKEKVLAHIDRIEEKILSDNGGATNAPVGASVTPSPTASPIPEQSVSPAPTPTPGVSPTLTATPVSSATPTPIPSGNVTV